LEQIVQKKRENTAVE